MGVGASQSRVWSQEWNRGAIELPPACPQALSAGAGEAHTSLGGVRTPGEATVCNCNQAYRGEAWKGSEVRPQEGCGGLDLTAKLVRTQSCLESLGPPF